MPDLPTGTVTFLFTDLEGSTQIWESQPEAMRTALTRHDRLLREAIPHKPPGFAFATGTIAPVGRGGLQPPGPTAFGYLAVTQAFFKEDDFLIHANVGFSALHAATYDPLKLTWGVGTQIETLFDFHLIGEVFSGDPYAVGGGGAFQLGFRQIYNDHLQLDFTYGAGLWGDDPTPPWFSSGIRIVSHKHEW